QTLQAQLKALPPGQSVIVSGLTSDAEAKIRQVGYDVTHMPDGTVIIYGDAGPVVAAAHNAVRYINGLTAWIDIQGNMQVKGGARMQATGGPGGGPTVINERGAEIVNLPTGSRVLTAANTRIELDRPAGLPRAAT